MTPPRIDGHPSQFETAINQRPATDQQSANSELLIMAVAASYLARVETAAATVDPARNPRIGSTVDMHSHPPVSRIGDRGRFGGAARRRIAPKHQVTSRCRERSNLRPSPQLQSLFTARQGPELDAT